MYYSFAQKRTGIKWGYSPEFECVYCAVVQGGSSFLWYHLRCKTCIVPFLASVGEILKCDNSNESYRALLSRDAV